mmetsp:Transcript_12062/g.36206  ORF Transcript_12062/g.36206 Transcript_12062/m.36206 type:complete len:81 (-) Transcript_12062:523-765(-)
MPPLSSNQILLHSLVTAQQRLLHVSAAVLPEEAAATPAAGAAGAGPSGGRGVPKMCCQGASSAARETGALPGDTSKGCYK